MRLAARALFWCLPTAARAQMLQCTIPQRARIVVTIEPASMPPTTRLREPPQKVRSLILQRNIYLLTTEVIFVTL